MYRRAIGRRIGGALRTAKDRVASAWPLRGSSRLAWALLAMCFAASASAALVVRAGAQRDAVRAFDVDATTIESNVAISLKRADDVAVALATTLATERRAMTNSGLARWYAGVSAGGRYPGLLGFTYIRYVPAARLAQFAADVRVFPSGAALATVWWRCRRRPVCRVLRSTSSCRRARTWISARSRAGTS